MSNLRLVVPVPGSLTPAVAEAAARDAVDELARAMRGSQPLRDRGGLRASISPTADPIVLVMPRRAITGHFEALIGRGAWASEAHAEFIGVLAATIYGAQDPHTVVGLTAAHAVCLVVRETLKSLDIHLSLRIPLPDRNRVEFILDSSSPPRGTSVNAGTIANLATTALAAGRDWRECVPSVAAAVAKALGCTLPPPSAPAVAQTPEETAPDAAA